MTDLITYWNNLTQTYDALYIKPKQIKRPLQEFMRLKNKFYKTKLTYKFLQFFFQFNLRLCLFGMSLGLSYEYKGKYPIPTQMVLDGAEKASDIGGFFNQVKVRIEKRIEKFYLSAKKRLFGHKEPRNQSEIKQILNQGFQELQKGRTCFIQEKYSQAEQKFTGAIIIFKKIS